MKWTAILKMILTATAFFSMTHSAVAQSERVFPELRPPTDTAKDIRVIGFAGGFNLPIWVAERQGFFADEGLKVNLDFTPGSTYQMSNLIAGNYDIAMTTFDNVIAYREGQGEAWIPPGQKIDVVSVLASDNGFLSISAQPDVESIAALKGRTITVDAMTTGFAFVMREMLARNGVEESSVKFERAGGVASRYRDMLTDKSHAATIQMTPFDLLGQAAGLRTLARVSDELGPYQGMTAAVSRSWAQQNRQSVVGFIRAYRKAIDWLYDPQNRQVAEAILVANAGASMTPALAKGTLDIMLTPETGFFRDSALHPEGMKLVLALRSKYGIPARALSDPEPYLDLSFYQQANM